MPTRELVHKSSGASSSPITVADVDLTGPFQKLLVVGAGDNGPGQLTYGGVPVAGTAFAVSLPTVGATLWVVEGVGPATEDLVVTPPGGQAAFALLVTRWTGLSTQASPGCIGTYGQEAVGVGTSLVDDPGGVTQFARSLLYGFVVTEGGLVGDDPGAWGGGYTNGERLAASAGGVDFVLAETFRYADAVGSYPLSKTGMTSRDWNAALVEVARRSATPSRRLHGEYTREEIFARTGVVVPGSGEE